MKKLFFLFFITFGALFAKSYNFKETRYSEALDKSIILKGVIDFQKDSLSISYDKEKKVIKYKNGQVKLFENSKEVDIPQKQASFMSQYFEILLILHNHDDSVLEDDFEIMDVENTTVLFPIGFLKNFIEEIDLRKRDNEYKDIKLVLKNGDTITINIYDEIH
jgi:archaellin